MHGEKDKAGSAKSYNKKWHQREEVNCLNGIKNAGHRFNADQPDEVNRLIKNLSVRLRENDNNPYKISQNQTQIL